MTPDQRWPRSAPDGGGHRTGPSWLEAALRLVGPVLGSLMTWWLDRFVG